MEDNRKHKKNRGHRENGKSKIQNIPVHTLMEPRPTCSICNNVIESIADSFCEPDGSYSHFDCVMEKLKKEHPLREGQTLSYIGRGTFGICEKNEEGKFIIVERIQYENADTFTDMKKFVESNKI